jgi:hypothetical protein
LDARRLYLGAGCASLFAYCTRVLHLSEHAAYGRIEAARAARRFPSLLEGLAEGELTLTAVGLLAPYLTPENVASVLQDARHKSVAPLTTTQYKVQCTISGDTYEKLRRVQDRGLSDEGADERRARDLSNALRAGGVSEPLDQSQAGIATVSRTRLGQSEDGFVCDGDPSATGFFLTSRGPAELTTTDPP